MTGRKSFERRLRELAAIRDSIKRDFLAELEASANLKINGTPVVIAKQRTCGRCGQVGHNSRTCPEKGKKHAARPIAGRISVRPWL
jgi:hypothetical protein